MSCRVDAGSSVADENKLKDMCGEENKEENKRKKPCRIDADASVG